MELIDVPHFGWKPENSVLGLSAFVDFEITGFAFFGSNFESIEYCRFGIVQSIPFYHIVITYIYIPQPGGSYSFKVLICRVIL